ncbi:Di-copper centre-containing protein [Daldinia decipiens]|uniref:Di-copper centre-containing protein n=1 Tax=Daldinia decipiens TaxID=326647 RepID=UPI0020C31CD4|nr:Di-copper centre-containing protein [Daldinia decipiens]KAI1662546.1 Di-copper centre-containing protein [Daldinia decipiens]
MLTLTSFVYITFMIINMVSGRIRSKRSEESCGTSYVRNDWRTLSQDQRLDFISAVRCLQSRSGETSGTFAGVKSRYDDFVALHISQADYIHWVGHFLPWHRYFLWLFEQALRNECSYEGSVPAIDWTQDAVDEASLLGSPIFDPEYGFGGNGDYIEDISDFPDEWVTDIDIPGRSGGGCLANGPFAETNASMGPGRHTEYTPRCIRRDFSLWLMLRTLNADTANFVLDASSYFEFEHRTEGLTLGILGVSVHSGGHLGIGGMLGDMANTWSSTVDPIFWVHHCAIDRLWDIWQRKVDWESRRSDIGGPDTQWAYPYNYFGEKPYTNVTLDFAMNFGDIGGMVNIREVMDVQDSPLCFAYS